MSDDRAALALQLAWGADEALLEAAQDRRIAAAEAPATRARAAQQAAPLPAGPTEAARIAQGCESLPALEQALAGFTGCALRETATRLVFGDGPMSARLMLVGEAPGAEEDRAGRPFIGPAGQLLERMLGSIGLARGEVRMTNVLPWRPPGDRSPTVSEIMLCMPFLLRHIALVRPSCVLLLGAVAAKALPGEAPGIGRLRGNWRELAVPGEAPIPCLASWHPAYLQRVPAAKADAWADLLKIREFLELGGGPG